jgi:hypothetical protein
MARDNLPELPASAQDRGELLQAIRQLAKDRYLVLEIGTEEEFEELWSRAFFADAVTPKTGKAPN